MARFTRGADLSRRSRLAIGLSSAIVTLMCLGLARADEDDEEAIEQPVAVANDSAEEEAAESGVSLPTDRLRERQLDRARRLVADKRWSDAATLLDEILAADRDFFFCPDLQKSTWRSIKSDASRLVGELPPEGREAYGLQFRARAERLLAQAIAHGDADGVIAVARRWPHTPAGQQATVLAALAAIDDNQPLAAIAWLDRLTAASAREFEPTVSLMRAKAWWLAGQRDKALEMLEQARATGAASVRVGGRDVSLSFPPGNNADGAAAFLASIAGDQAVAGDATASAWWMHRGDAARNAVSAATRPLLVPRYRVPLTRHPEESRLLENRRRLCADRDDPLLPAGKPLAVGGLIVLHTPMGLLAVDFDSGKRVWLQTGGSAALWIDGPGAMGTGEAGDEDMPADGAGSVLSVFGDATSGTLSSNGRFVFAVETNAADVARPAAANGMRRIIAGATRQVGNRLSAYDALGKGALRWRLPAAGPRDDEAAGEETWYMGAPLVLGDQLFVLVEERGEIRLDVLAAADGAVVWSQPLAELDEEQAADTGRAQQRRLAGLSPSFADGVLVCPTGSGTLVAVDLATRTLLWASNYAVPTEQGAQVMRFGVRVQVGGLNGRGLVLNGQLGGAATAAGGWRDAAPIVAAGRVILGAVEAEKLLCLDLRSGGLVWEVPRGESLYVAGVVDGRVIVVGSDGVDALSLADGRRAWDKPVDCGAARPSGCGVVTPTRLFLPTDAPEIVEIALADGSIVGRSPARSGVVPGNLVAHRGELISQGVDSLDVFHQAAPLEERLETALKQAPADPWATLWRGQLDLDRGEIESGLRRIRAARAASPERVNAEVVSDAIFFAMRRDFAAAAPLWRQAVAEDGRLPRSEAMLRLAVDRFMLAGDIPSAWATFRECLGVADEDPDGDGMVEDASDPVLTVSGSRWFQGRLPAVRDRAAPELRAEIDAFVTDRARQVLEPGTADTQPLERFLAAFGSHPAALGVKRALVGALDREAAAGEAGRAAAVRRDLVRLEVARAEGGLSEDAPAEGVADASGNLGAAWPVGRVVAQRAAKPRSNAPAPASRAIPIPVDVRPGALVPDLQLGYEFNSQMLVARDGLGRRIGEPFAFRVGGMPHFFQAVGAEATLVGRIVLIRSGPLLAAYSLPVVSGDGKAAESPQRLWVASDGTDPTASLPGMGFAIGRNAGRSLKRSGNVPLGMAISEPEETQLPARGVQATARGVAILSGRSLELRDPVSGDVIWQRHRLPVDGDLFGDEDFLCVCPRDGKGAVVVSMVDGRVERTCDLPRHEQRLMTAGRGIVVIDPVAARRSPLGGIHQQVKLELIDPVTLARRSLGTFAGEARAAAVGAGRLAVVEPNGQLTLVDAGRNAAAGARFSVKLNDMPAGLQNLQVIPWEDRFLVIVGRQETADEQQRFGKMGSMSPLPLMVPGGEPAAAVTGSVWAVARENGEMLWPVPATIVRHVLVRHQPSALPLLLFARTIIPPREGERHRLSLLCLDKRTGHAVHVDDKIAMPSQMPIGCDAIGDPATHEIAFGFGDGGRNRGDGGESTGLRLVFTGEPTPPQPPYQASTKPPVTGDLATELEYWLRKALTMPLPF
ncbi:MAG: PQQ-binding-like beta-propeller repeat protein [Planctomycetia bacterium]|jgi:outer membrane protein assembly factor BamB